MLTSNCRSLLNTIKTRKCQYFGHIIIRDTLQRLLMEGRTNGRRGRGRSRTMRADNIREWENHHTMTVSEWHKIENDGDPWQPTCWLQMAHNDDDELYTLTVIPYYPQYLSPTWSCYYFLQWAARYSVLHIYTPSWSGSDGGLQSSYCFLIIQCWTAIWHFGVSRSPSISWLSYPHSWWFSRSYYFLFGMQCSLCLDLWFDFGPLFSCCWLEIPSDHGRTALQTIKYR